MNRSQKIFLAVLAVVNVPMYSYIGFTYLREHPPTVVETVCVTPLSHVSTEAWQLYVTDQSKFPVTSNDPSWPFTPVAEGTGMLCGDVPLAHGHVMKINGMFMEGADAPDSHPAFWAWNVNGTNVTKVTVNGTDITGNVQNVGWQTGKASGADGIFVAKPFSWWP